MSIYVNENPEFLRESLKSLLASTVQPDELVLVEDGPIGENLRAVIESFRARLPIRTVPLAVNLGLPGALNAGLTACSHDIVARFDTDDICVPQRFARQLDFMKRHPEIAALGTAVQEFDPYTGENLGVRAPPATHEELLHFAKLSSPFNHPATMYKKSAVLSVGAYPTHMTVAYEDYALWVRLMMAGYKVANLLEILVYMRAGEAQATRRRGWRYAKQEVEFALEFRKAGFLSIWQCVKFMLLRVPIRFLPARQMALIYRRFARVSKLSKY